MVFEKLSQEVNMVIHTVWPEDVKYMPLYTLHGRLLNAMGYKKSKQKNWRFCRLLKAAIKASVSCKEVTLKGYRRYKRV